jgi:hypothetical protein
MSGFQYNIDIPSFFVLLPEIIISSLAKKANMNASLLRQYKIGSVSASEEQARKIEKAIHELGSELLSVKL